MAEELDRKRLAALAAAAATTVDAVAMLRLETLLAASGQCGHTATATRR